MFKLEDFEEYPDLITHIKKINKYINKEKFSKLKSKVDELILLLETDNLAIPITYILSIIAEHIPSLISKDLIKKIYEFLDSEKSKLKLNSILILGFFLLDNKKSIKKKHYKVFSSLLRDDLEDIRNNSYYFLHELLELNPQGICDNIDAALDAFEIEIREENETNIFYLINFIKSCESLNFKQLFRLRQFSLDITMKFYSNPQLMNDLLDLLSFHFEKLQIAKPEDLDKKDLMQSIQNLYISLKIDFNRIQKQEGTDFTTFLSQFKKNTLPEKEIYFYTQDKENRNIAFYELERDKTIKFFSINKKISREDILSKYSNILEDNELDLFIKTMIKLNQIKGYLSEFYFYPSQFIKSNFISKLNNKGFINFKDFNYLPIKFVYSLIKEISSESDIEILFGKDKKSFYSLKYIQKNITSLASKESSIDLKEYRENLTDKSFIRLVKSLPSEYFTKLHKGVSMLTNIGKFRIKKEIDNSKLIGYFDIERISDKLNINLLFLYDIFNEEIDLRSGIWNKERNIFYYSNYIKEKIDKINLVQDEDERITQINKLALELDIDKNKILSKIDENLKSIGEEIKTKEKIKISEYLEKTRMDDDSFLNFINEMELTYLKQGDFLILNPSKIENTKNEIKKIILRDAGSQDYIIIGNYDINSKLMSELIEDLQEKGDLNGIFYEDEGEVKFFTEKGIKNMMLSNTFLFSFYDLFYGKELTDKEIDILKEIFNELYKKGRLKGEFDKENLTFTSEEIIFANDYNICLDQFNSKVDKYIEIFNSEFNKIKKILTKKETIFPQEIKSIQNSIDKINNRYVFWRSELDAYVNRVNKELLNNQGYSIKKAKNLSYLDELPDDVKFFTEDEEVKEIMEAFNLWVKLFNQIELKYQNIIFYQKRLKNNPKDKETENKLIKLMKELNLG